MDDEYKESSGHPSNPHPAPVYHPPTVVSQMFSSAAIFGLQPFPRVLRPITPQLITLNQIALLFSIVLLPRPIHIISISTTTSITTITSTTILLPERPLQMQGNMDLSMMVMESRATKQKLSCHPRSCRNRPSLPLSCSVSSSTRKGRKVAKPSARR